MQVIEEKKKFSKKLTKVAPPALLFKVVVNNYKLQKEEELEKIVNDNDPLITAEPIGLPPQPARYLKYPEYDWF